MRRIQSLLSSVAFFADTVSYGFLIRIGVYEVRETNFLTINAHPHKYRYRCALLWLNNSQYNFWEQSPFDLWYP